MKALIVHIVIRFLIWEDYRAYLAGRDSLHGRIIEMKRKEFLQHEQA